MKKKIFALVLLTIFVNQIFFPTVCYALTSGPSQPEVQSFTPISTTEMVDLFTGGFNYNIPLLDVEGYPVNIGYNSGITMDQEASWVGLGWNINPGVINRNMRGIPDDFAGDIIQKDYNIRPNRTYGIKAGVNFQLFGQNKPKIGIGFYTTLRFNNYSGIGIENSASASHSAGIAGQLGMNAKLGLTASSDEGLTIQPSVGFSFKRDIADRGNAFGVRFGSSFNSRAGLKQLSITTSISSYGTYEHDSERTYSQDLVAASSQWDYGTPTYTPQLTLPYENFSITGSFTLGAALYGFHPDYMMQGFYSAQKLSSNSITTPAYGYLHKEKGGRFGQLDFNREKDHNFTENTPALPLANQTFDIFSVSGQGTGGSYRPFRSDYSFVYDPAVYNSGASVSIGLEVGVGGAYHGGVDYSVVSVSSKSGVWAAANDAYEKLRPRSETSDPLYEKFYFKEANEKTVINDPAYYNKMGGVEKASTLEINNEPVKYPTLTPSLVTGGSTSSLPDENYRTVRENRNNSFNMIPKSQLSAVGINDPKDLPLYSSAKPHHIGEITTMGADGKRFIYGIAAYNTHQEDVTFAVGSDIYGGHPQHGVGTEGFVNYTPNEDNTVDQNKHGLDNYYSKTTLPPYAHSYLLTAVLDPEYIDNDNVRGPSEGDYGNYTKFNYERIQDFSWRTPIGSQGNTADHHEGLLSTDHDDKASYIYGTKDIYYLSEVETKNYVAVFTLNDQLNDQRKDGFGADENGNLNLSKPLMFLRKISLFSKKDLNTPIKEVHFVYNYELCPGVPNHINPGTGGKLTLKEIYFTYGANMKGRFSPYIFNYDSENYPYEMKAQDRWGNYKPLEPYGSPDRLDFPYVEQNKNDADQYSSAWHLTSIVLPSGGKINIEYESDDYQYVQSKPAQRMFKIVNTVSWNGSDYDHEGGTLAENIGLVINKEPGTNKYDYANEGDIIYFKCMVNYMGTAVSEYITGYAEIEHIHESPLFPNQLIIRLEDVPINDAAIQFVSPISKAGIQFGRKYMPDVINADLPLPPGQEPNFAKDLLLTLLGSVSAVLEGFGDPNLRAYNKIPLSTAHCRSLQIDKSFIRLNCPNKIKYGGGNRVKKIIFSNEWYDMTGYAENSQSYGQEYEYKLADGTTSGVAAYEPMIGNDENPWRQPVFYPGEPIPLGPDEEFYIEEPFGESFFPAPVVGYSRVKVKNIKPANTTITRRGTGFVVNEFFTAKDFPTITQRTDITPEEPRKRPSKSSIRSLLKIDYYDYLTASQGFFIETNDMHGKPKFVKVYKEKQLESEKPISEIEYRYKKKPHNANSFKLVNTATVIDDKGIPHEGEIGVNMDFVADLRRSESRTESASLAMNAEGFIIFIPLLVTPVWPGYTKEITMVSTAVITKVVHRFGLLDEVIKKDLGAIVSIKNKAYDAVTGDVILTETKNDFSDPVYSLTIPAHWHYKSMGPASKNLGLKLKNKQINDGNCTVGNAKNYFVEGDELFVVQGQNSFKAWISQVGNDYIKVIDYKGEPLNPLNDPNYRYNFEIIRSGRKNLQSTPIASITTLTNPVNTIQNNIFEKVIQAQAIEYGNAWKTYCECLEGSNYTKNPFITGNAGNWNVLRTYAYLTHREQSELNANTNIRKDGVYSSFTPFYKFVNNQCEIDPINWTFASEVTQLSPSGFELENKDAIGIFSAATYGYNHTLPTAIAKNSEYVELAVDNFEDYLPGVNCRDRHFKVDDYNQTLGVVVGGHTGKYSMKVNSANPAVYTKQVYEICVENPCGIVTNFNPQVPGTGTMPNPISITSGNGPFNISWSFLEGSAPVYVSPPPGTGVTVVSGLDAYTIQLTITDINGCRAIKKFEYLP